MALWKHVWHEKQVKLDFKKYNCITGWGYSGLEVILVSVNPIAISRQWKGFSPGDDLPVLRHKCDSWFQMIVP